MMSIPYSVTIIGCTAAAAPRKGSQAPFAATSIKTITDALVAGFAALPHVEVAGVVDVTTDLRALTAPPCDLVVSHCLFHGDTSERRFPFDVREVKARCGCRKVVSVLEAASPHVDHNFTFCPNLRNPMLETVVGAPCVKSLMVNVRKDDRAVLIDHDWPDQSFVDRGLCRGQEIKAALAPLADRFAFRQLGGYPTLSPLPPWVTPLEARPFPEYLEATARFGTFVVTHTESWGHSIVDMAARGIRVLAPRGFVGPALADVVQPLLFDTTAELVSLLKQPIDHEAWARKIDRMISFDEVCRIIDSHFQVWMT